MKQVKYEGPYGALEVDGIVIKRGESAELTNEQYERIKGKRGRRLRVIPKAVKPKARG